MLLDYSLSSPTARTQQQHRATRQGQRQVIHFKGVMGKLQRLFERGRVVTTRKSKLGYGFERKMASPLKSTTGYCFNFRIVVVA